MKRTNKWSFFLILSLLFSSLAASGSEWTRFRGPDGQGISKAKTIPVKWSEKDYRWKVPLPGIGHSSPVIWGDQVFVTSGDQEANKGYLLALRVTDGKTLWKKEFDLPESYVRDLNCYATGSPAVDAERVYAIWPSSQKTTLAAFDHNGQEAWQAEFPGVNSTHGPGNSVIVVGNLVVFSHEQKASKKSGAAEGAWIAVNAKTGKLRWTCPRDNGESISYSTPCLYRPAKGNPQIIFTSRSHGMTAIDPATGEIIWENSECLPARAVSSPVIAGNLIFGSCGSGSAGKRLVAIRPGVKGKPGSATEAFELKGPLAPYVSTGLAKDGLLFTFHDKGDVACIDTATGKDLWCERPGGKFYGSPVWLNGNLYCINMDGEVMVIRASREYKLLAINPLGEGSHATPAIADERMFLRTFSHLICIEGKEK